MDTKGSPKVPVSPLANPPITNPIQLKERTFYVAIKGSLHASDCSIFGLGEEEIKALSKKYDMVINGFSIRENVLQVLNLFSKLGYRIISSTGAQSNQSLSQTLSEMDWERGLWYAAFNGEEERVKTLIEKSRNTIQMVNAPDNSGYTALHYAARNGHINICKILLSNGACINAQTHGNATPLHKAAAAGNIAAVRFLIESGAIVDQKDIDGETALHKAVKNNKNDLVNILLDVCPQLRHMKDHKGELPTISE